MTLAHLPVEARGFPGRQGKKRQGARSGVYFVRSWFRLNPGGGNPTAGANYWNIASSPMAFCHEWCETFPEHSLKLGGAYSRRPGSKNFSHCETGVTHRARLRHKD